MLTEQKNKAAKLFPFTATTSNPWDEVQFNFWKHKVTNMVLSSNRLALNDDAKSDVSKLLFSTGDHNNVTVSSGDKRNISGLLICHPILLNSPFVEPAGNDRLLDDLLLERHPYTVAKANDNVEVMRQTRPITRSSLSRRQLCGLCGMSIKSHSTPFMCTSGIFYLAQGKIDHMFSLR